MTEGQEFSEELSDMLDAALTYAIKYEVKVHFETPYYKCFVRPDGEWCNYMKDAHGRIDDVPSIWMFDES